MWNLKKQWRFCMLTNLRLQNAGLYAHSWITLSQGVKYALPSAYNKCELKCQNISFVTALNWTEPNSGFFFLRWLYPFLLHLTGSQSMLLFCWFGFTYKSKIILDYFVLIWLLPKNPNDVTCEKLIESSHFGLDTDFSRVHFTNSYETR